MTSKNHHIDINNKRGALPFSFLRSHIAIIATFIVGIAIRVYMARIDPFLHEWDERFHALVARNMMKYPFKPMLVANPLTAEDPNAWCCNHIWLHKQPLFMWQMALSMKLFGVSEFTVRLPSIIMGSLTILLLYRITLLLTRNKAISIIAGLLICFSGYQLELISGRRGMDHNDMAFCFYVLASIWSYCEYINKPKWYWAILAGVFSGCAVLNKWLTGLLVFSAWGIAVLFKLRKKNWRAVAHFVAALVASIIIFLPWQLYILKQFPAEASYEFALNARHIWEVIEDHTGGMDFYYIHLPEYLGSYIWVLVFPGILLMLLKRSYTYCRPIALSLLCYVVIVFSFFSFVVTTKIISFFYVASPLCLIFISIALYHIIVLFRRWAAIHICVFAGLLSVSLYYIFNPLQIVRSVEPGQVRDNKIHNAETYRNLQQKIPANIHTVISAHGLDNIDIMFYNNHLNAHHWWYYKEDFDTFRTKKIPIAIFESNGQYEIPDFVKSYPYLYIIPHQIK